MQVVFFIVYMFEALIAFMYFYDNFEMKKGYLFTVGTVTALYLLGFAANIIDKNTYVINLFVFVIINIIFALLCFNISILSCIFHVTIISALMTLSEIVVEMAVSYLFKIPSNAYKDSLTVLIILAALSKALYLILCKFISFFFSYKKNADNKSTYFIFFFPLIILVVLSQMFNASITYHFSYKTNLLFAILSVISLFFCCFIFIYNRYVQNQQQELFELQQQSLKNEIDMQYLGLLEKKNQEMQILTHDYKNHLSAIRGLSSSGEVNEYIDSITSEINFADSTCQSGNHTLDVIINKYVTECMIKGVSFDYEIKLSNLSSVNDYDLVTILGNLLDNALEAAQNSAKKSISLKTNKINTYDSIVVINSSDTPPEKNLKTTKQNKKLHGVGLKSVTKTLKKYGGELEWEYNNDTKEFITTVILLTN